MIKIRYYTFIQIQAISAIFTVMFAMFIAGVIFDQELTFHSELFLGVMLGVGFYCVNLVIWCFLVFFLLKPKNKENWGRKSKQWRFMVSISGLVLIAFKLIIIVGYLYTLSFMSTYVQLCSIFSFIILLLLGSILTTVVESKLCYTENYKINE